MTTNYYELLNIPFDATSNEIRTSYRELARQVHPDTNPSLEAKEQFIQLQTAYETLINKELREDYDYGLPKTFTTPALNIHPLFSRSFIQQMDEPQIMYVMLQMAPPGYDLSGFGTPLNLSLVIDCSTSMQGHLLDAVKSTAIELIRQLNENDIISIVSFNDQAEVIIPAAANQDKQLLQSSVRMLQAKGGTEIYKGLEAGYNEVQRFRSKKFANHIILITDGKTYGDENLCERLSEQAGVQNIGISGLGIGGKWNDTFLDRVTSKTGGSSMFVNKPQDVNIFLKQKVKNLGLSYAEHLEYDLALGEGIEIRSAFRIQPDLSQLELTYPLRMGNVLRNTPAEVIFDLLIHPEVTKVERTPIFKGRIYFDIPSRINPIDTVRLDIDRPTGKGNDPIPPPQAIVQAMSALTLYRIQEKARQDVENGQYQDATRRLQNVATHLLSRGERDLAQTVLNESRNIQHQHSFSEDGDKRIKYGTRALLLPPPG